MPTFVVKLKTMERLRDYMQTHVAVGGTVLFTPVLPIADTLLQLLVVHPVSEAEFALLGRVYRAVATPPKRLEILFERTDMVAFARFVDSGLPPAPVVHPPQPAAPTVIAPTPKPDAPVEKELDFEISDDDEEMEDDPIEWDLHTSDLPVILGRSTSMAPKPATTAPKPADDGPHAPITSFEGQDVSFTLPGGRPAPDLPSDELLIDDTVVATDPGFRPVSLRLSCETFGCPSEPYTIELGPCSGIVGLVADQVPYWSGETDRVVSVPRLIPAEVRRARFSRYVERGGQMDDVVDLATFLAAADLAEAPRHPVTGEHLRSSRAIERLAAAARRAVDEDTQAATRIRCPRCSAGHLLVERA
jgi:hypothetical protein